MKLTNNTLPFSLSQILLNVPDHDFRPNRASLSALEFDTRRDFIITKPYPLLAVRMVFANEHCIKGDSSRGIRRNVSVCLIDAVNQKLMSSTDTSVCIKSGCFSRSVTTWLPIEFDEVNFKHTYLIVIRDRKSGQLLGEQSLRFFRHYYSHTFMTDLLKPVYGGIEPDFSPVLYKAFDAKPMTYHYASFYLIPDEGITLPPYLPEMEVKIYFPDGSIESSFFVPVVEKDYDVYDEVYRVSASFYMSLAKKGICYAELLCFEEAIAGFVFDTDGEPVSGIWTDSDLEFIEEYSLEEASSRLTKSIKKNNGNSTPAVDIDVDKLLDEFIKSQQEPEPSDTEETDDVVKLSEQTIKEENLSTLQPLENLTGLHSVKEKLTAYEKLMFFNKKRQENDLPTMNLPLHAMFCGSPGTGKTTVAKHMGSMLKSAGVLSSGHVVVKERATLIGKYYSDEETNTLKAIEDARGGILFIDEAYQLYQPDDPKDPGKFVIETLMTALADESCRDWMLILAGYTDEMKRMFEMNPGLKSRIPDSNIYEFDDFSESELMEIAERYLERHCYSMTSEARSTLATRIGIDYRNRDRNFGNARHVINMIQTEILPAMASRVVMTNSFDPLSLSLIQSDDIPQPKNIGKSQCPKIGYCA